ncbi:hypothetical protein KQ941_01920 [Paenibacillus xylanexedens]|uniref:hypothetical protein n=1 Tax=Paenibacillus xylanexedens TaxID=528191 RepID=UPI001F15D705|nr:hypothetical protein [Paenibacillus xylanexedens]MCF7753183.1 hypothetical protein [Paenibacillus xylanexedens]
MFSQLAVVLDIRDDNGNIVVPKTHQFRHHAVTDRLYTVGYTMDQIRKLTGHKNMAMQKFYTHQVIEKHKEIHLGIQGLSTPEDSSYEFRGKIVNLDERTVSHLSKDKKKYLTWEANGKKGVGICSDITGCNPKGTTVHFECYACNWFVPKVEFYEDYKTEHAFWQNVVDQTSQNPNRAAHFENAVRNMSYLERIIKICELGVEQHKQDTLEEQINVSPIHELNWE